MREKFLRLSKVALLLVVVGFFMPISCNLNGFDIGRILINPNSIHTDFFSGILFFVVFLSAVFSILTTVINLVKKQKDSLKVAWIFLTMEIISVCCISYRLFRNIREGLQYGANIIVLGIGLSLIFLICASANQDKANYG